MKLSLVCVGRPRGPVAEAIHEYEKRLTRYFRFEAIEVRESSGRGGRERTIVFEEGERLLARVPPGAELVALHRTGTSWSSEQLAAHLSAAAVNSSPGMAFVIGGAYGLSEPLLERAVRRLSLSAMTLPHELARLVLTEQLYRAGTIQRSEPYHKGSDA